MKRKSGGCKRRIVSWEKEKNGQRHRGVSIGGKRSPAEKKTIKKVQKDRKGLF